MTPSLPPLLLLTLLTLFSPTYAVLPTSQLTLTPPSSPPTTYYASSAGFGIVPNLQDVQITTSPATEEALCGDLDEPTDEDWVPPATPFLLLAPRGNCTFQTKTLRAAQYGAAGLLIYNTEESLYYRNSSTPDTPTFPLPKADYECGKGQQWVPESQLIKPYWSPHNDQFMAACSSDSKCKSSRCVATGTVNEGEMEVCCAWDLHQYLYGSGELDNPSIGAGFLTIAEGEEVLKGMGDGGSATFEERPRPSYNLSSVIIWAVGTFVVVLASYVSGGDLLHQIKFLKNGERSKVGQSSGVAGGQGESVGRLDREEHIGGGESMELNSRHAVGFLIMSSATLLILFFFNLYLFVTIMYAFGCSGAFSQVLLYPLLKKVRDLTKGQGESWWDKVCVTVPCDVGECTRLEVVGTVAGYVVGGTWLVYALSENAPQYPFYWIVQDLFGGCMCVLFLSVIRLPSIKVASYLLVAAFFYDIFFVFITPLIFTSSVMITVATGGAGPTTDPLTCEKYPTTDGCRVPNPLPMLFAIPKIGDYQGGSSLLGLGDIVLPGLLLSFAWRLDMSKVLVRMSGRGGVDEGARGGYFVYLCVGYGIGLMMANIAVYLMEMGQPALLYLVPMTLGWMVWLAVRRGEVAEIWGGPTVMKHAYDILDIAEEGGVIESESDKSGEENDGRGLLNGGSTGSTIV